MSLSAESFSPSRSHTSDGTRASCIHCCRNHFHLLRSRDVFDFLQLTFAPFNLSGSAFRLVTPEACQCVGTRLCFKLLNVFL